MSRPEGDWSAICDTIENVNGDPNEPCHCGYGVEDVNGDPASKAGDIYSSVTCRIIEQLAFEKALSIFLFLYDLIVIAICAYWLVTFWRHRHMRAYKYSLKVRRPFYMLLSYAMILPFIFEEGIGTIYLFWADVYPKRNQLWDGVNWWTHYDGAPIYFDRNADIALHFFYWFGFWSFFQLKIFKLWMLRYDYEYSKEMSNIEWKDHLGLRTVEPTSFFIRYRSILGNSFLMFFLQLVILVIVIFIQIFIRLVPLLQQSPSASMIEGILILIIAVSEFLFIVWLMHQIRAVNDNFYLKAESSRIFIASLVGGGSWIIGLIVASTASDISFIWVKTGTILLFTTWICVYCYFETIWVLKRIDDDWVKTRPQPQQQGPNGHNRSQSIYQFMKLGDILQVQEGFEAMMRFLVKEFSCENLLCYVELSQYITTWQPPSTTTASHIISSTDPMSRRQNNNPMSYENIGSDPDDDQSVTVNVEQHHNNINNHIHQMEMNKHHNNHNNHNNNHQKNGSMGDSLHGVHDGSDQLRVDHFPYFENPEFEDELAHYEYIMQKYIYDSACLQINISGALRNEAQTVSPGMESSRIIKMINDIRAELWSLMRDSFTRFRSTVEYKRLAEVLQTKLPNPANQNNPNHHHHHQKQHQHQHHSPRNGPM